MGVVIDLMIKDVCRYAWMAECQLGVVRPLVSDLTHLYDAVTRFVNNVGMGCDDLIMVYIYLRSYYVTHLAQITEPSDDGSNTPALRDTHQYNSQHRVADKLFHAVFVQQTTMYDEPLTVDVWELFAQRPWMVIVPGVLSFCDIIDYDVYPSAGEIDEAYFDLRRTVSSWYSASSIDVASIPARDATSVNAAATAVTTSATSPSLMLHSMFPEFPQRIAMGDDAQPGAQAMEPASPAAASTTSLLVLSPSSPMSATSGSPLADATLNVSEERIDSALSPMSMSTTTLPHRHQHRQHVAVGLSSSVNDDGTSSLALDLSCDDELDEMLASSASGASALDALRTLVPPAWFSSAESSVVSSAVTSPANMAVRVTSSYTPATSPRL